MSCRTRASVLIAALWLVSAPVGCALKSHPYEIDELHIGAPSVEAVGLLPLNVLTALPPELDVGVDGVTAQIHTHLERCERRVVPFSVGEARGAWTGVAGPEAVFADEEDTPELLRRFVEDLRSLRDFDVLVVPALVVREARVRVSTQEAAWDGVERKLAVKGFHYTSGAFHGNTKIRGPTPGASLHVMALAPGGARVFEGYGGLDLIHEWELRTEWRTDPSQHQYRVPVHDVRLKDDRLADEAQLREGVAMAFHPYLVPAGQALPGTPAEAP